MCTLSVSNVIYHKFSHGAAFCTLNGKNVNVMLESILQRICSNVNQVIKTLILSHMQNMRILAQVVLTILCLQGFYA